MKKGALLISGLVLTFFPEIVSAHSFGRLYNLPVPFWMYLYGAVAAMVVSFLFIGYFFEKKKEVLSLDRRDLSGIKFFDFLRNQRMVTILKVVSVLLFLLTILSGLFGENNSYSNFNMTFFWIIFLLGLTYLSALLGDIWSVINPFKTLTDWFVGKDAKPLLQYPSKLGYYPALFFYFILIWVELVGDNTPLQLSILLLSYTIINDLGVIFLGRRVWFKYCEFFSVFFRLIGKIAPLQYSNGKIYLRPPFRGLLEESADHPSLLIFVLFMLSSTAFDGLKETRIWSKFYWGYIDAIIRPVFDTLSYPTFETLGLIISLAVFLFIYLVSIFLGEKIAKSTVPSRDLVLQFTFSLIPIALVYNIAHYYTLILSQGFRIINLISDPLGHGWDLFGTATLSTSKIIGASFVWHSEVAFILLGHIVAVYLAHLVALRIFPSGKRALWSGLPMLVMMILYTVLGLWILSVPLSGKAL